jgi:hypothetical protein
MLVASVRVGMEQRVCGGCSSQQCTIMMQTVLVPGPQRWMVII